MSSLRGRLDRLWQSSSRFFACSWFFAGFRWPQRPPSHFSLSRQRKVTKRKATQVSRPSLRFGFASDERGFQQHIRVLMKTRAHPCARPYGPCLPPAAAAQEGAQDQEQRQTLANCECCRCRCSGSCTRVPYVAATVRRKARREARMDAREFVVSTRTCCQQTPTHRRAPAASSPAPLRGRLLFGYFLLAKQEKVTRLPLRQAKPRGKPTTRQQSQSWIATAPSALRNDGVVEFGFKAPPIVPTKTERSQSRLVWT